MKEFTCIICPRGCQLIIDKNNNVTGNACPRGKEYAINEITNPTRTITTSIRVSNRIDTLVSVKTNLAIPKNLVFEAMEIINKLSIGAPTKIGQIVLKNILDTGADIIITKNID
ncbi:MAG: DUF1667 domain-containing protein [Bacilli bacterium]|nr:DUF1667 domain-containing protein [Bacilli bacterium]